MLPNDYDCWVGPVREGQPPAHITNRAKTVFGSVPLLAPHGGPHVQQQCRLTMRFFRQNNTPIAGMDAIGAGNEGLKRLGS